MLRSKVVMIYLLLVFISTACGLTMPGNVHRLKTSCKNCPKEKLRDTPSMLQDVEYLLQELIERRRERYEAHATTAFDQQPIQSTESEATKPISDHLPAPSQRRQTDEVEDKQRKDFISFKRALPKIRPRIGDVSKEEKDHTFNDYPLAFNKVHNYKSLLSKEGNYYDPLSSNKIHDINSLSTNRINNHKLQSSNKINDYNSQPTNDENKYNPLLSNNVNHNDPVSSHEANDYNPMLSNKVNHNNPLTAGEMNDYNHLSSNQEKENKREQSRDQYPGLWKSHGIERYHSNNVDQSESS